MKFLKLGKVFEGFCGESGEKEEERDGVGVVNRGNGDDIGERGEGESMGKKRLDRDVEGREGY